ncbi:MAG: CRISPR system precrRNA processing endoribonuclease RAMP protein Cas6 [Desulfatibacillaceae bacterium]
MRKPGKHSEHSDTAPTTRMQVGRYRFSCTCTNGGHVPSNLGFVLRRSLGNSMKAVVCSDGDRHCPDCSLSARCTYCRVFEDARTDHGHYAMVASPPKPFVITPDHPPGVQAPGNGRFGFDLVLLGRTDETLGHFYKAFSHMGTRGVMASPGSQRVAFAVENLASGGMDVLAKTGRLTLPEIPAKWVTWPPEPAPAEHVARCTVHMLTPMKIPFSRHFVTDLPFRDLMEAVVGRMETLFSYYGEGGLDVDRDSLLDMAGQVRVADSRLKWHGWRQRLPGRVDREPMAGLMGTVTYQGPVAAHLPLLRMAAEVHVGRDASAGCGKIRVDEK